MTLLQNRQHAILIDIFPIILRVIGESVIDFVYVCELKLLTIILDVFCFVLACFLRVFKLFIKFFPMLLAFFF
jgi:hypothetical protein